MNERSPLERARENLTGIVSVLVTGIWLAAMFTGQGWWLPFMLFGYIVIVPLTALLFGDEDDVAEWWDDEDSVESTKAKEHTDDQLDALETLRERYARGELTDEQFERKVERLLETETLEDIEDRSRAASSREDPAGDREPEREFS
ncbi:SHOCT domain-containing protein [Halapricum hydrolyticum]|uniref:SHOCT domain-containing protein n=1 Tax=Halapricum hydrolyticum TaxID=2979991 RepID=A0AAE3LEN2_9EURY|nr:SHOCT domain-containing protein [Halapricum hydrolyticum]MCU4717298.1 SHOCT domain-containing protein [Halapricum hydrolyticum]MCU4726225.1 SHOCT domain-containing protein [Halapricum hydrolyticum]